MTKLTQRQLLADAISLIFLVLLAYEAMFWWMI